ncbi:MAG: CDP-diacylglycerol--serine O-phosphatidyltransferase, partial [Cytophagales bacterium]
MIRQIPNFITLMNLLCGSIGVKILVSNPSVENFAVACACMYIGALLDFFDGLAAKLLNVKSELGKQLDSLADVVTFGLLPSLILHELVMKNMNDSIPVFVAMIPFSVVLFSAFRLANFNIDNRQTEEFIGLPTPANAMFISTFVWILVKADNYDPYWVELIFNPCTLAFVS